MQCNAECLWFCWVTTSLHPLSYSTTVAGKKHHITRRKKKKKKKEKKKGVKVTHPASFCA
jgi:hypothetical protein